MDQQVISMSERGLSPYANQDNVFYKVHQSAQFYAVADGMGGYNAGDVASRMTIEAIYASLREQLDEFTVDDVDVIADALGVAIGKANTAVFSYAQTHEYVMGSTITCAIVVDKCAVVANVGDSRTYLMRHGWLQQITVDHSLVEQFIQQGIISEAERFTNRNGHIVTRGIGNQPDIDVDIFTIDLEQDDQLLLCSDGLWGGFPDSHVLSDLLGQDTDMSDTGKQLVHAAMGAGSNDHISFVWAKLA